MPLAKKTTVTVLPGELEAQIRSNFSRDEGSPVTVDAPLSEPKPAEKESLRGRYADSVNLRLSSGKRNEFKMFFTRCEISMNQGFEAAVDYLIREVKEGRVKVSKGGITRISE